MDLVRGTRDKLSKYINPAEPIVIDMSINGPAVYDYCLFSLDSTEKLSDDRYMIFYNQLSSPNNEITYQQGANTAHYVINLNALPQTIEKLVFTVSIDGDGTMGGITNHTFSLSQNNIPQLTMNMPGTDFSQEKAIISIEIYRKGEWRISAVAKGFNGGLSVLLAAYGGEEDPEDAAPTPQAAPAPQATPAPQAAPQVAPAVNPGPQMAPQMQQPGPQFNQPGPQIPQQTGPQPMGPQFNQPGPQMTPQMPQQPGPQPMGPQFNQPGPQMQQQPGPQPMGPQFNQPGPQMAPQMPQQPGPQFNQPSPQMQQQPGPQFNQPGPQPMGPQFNQPGPQPMGPQFNQPGPQMAPQMSPQMQQPGPQMQQPQAPVQSSTPLKLKTTPAPTAPAAAPQPTQTSGSTISLKKNEQELTNSVMGKISLSKDKVNLEKHVVSLSKCVVSLSKKNGVDLGATRARVIVVLDYSYSMIDLYRGGVVQNTLNRLVPLGLTFDDNGEIDVYLFSDGHKELKSMNLSNYETYVNNIVLRSTFKMSSTYYAPVLKSIVGGTAPLGNFFGGFGGNKGGNQSQPTFVLFITDGDNFDSSATDDIIRKSSTQNIFIQFIGIGNDRFEYLTRLDDLDGRAVDNTGFSRMADLQNASDEDLYNNVLDQFSVWLKR